VGADKEIFSKNIFGNWVVMAGGNPTKLTGLPEGMEAIAAGWTSLEASKMNDL
jgi:hypothetical protein